MEVLEKQNINLVGGKNVNQAILNPCLAICKCEEVLNAVETEAI